MMRVEIELPCILSGEQIYHKINQKNILEINLKKKTILDREEGPN